MACGVSINQRCELGDDIRVFRIVGKIGELMGIRSRVQQHRAGPPAEEFGVAPLPGADRHAGEMRAVLAPDSVGGVIPRCLRSLHERREAQAFESGRLFESAEFNECRIEIDHLHHARADFSGGLLAGIADEQRRARSLFPERTGLGPLALLT